MNLAQMEARRESVTLAFLAENEGARVLKIVSPDTVIIGTGGLTQAQLKSHAMMCIVSLGLWVPVFGIICLLRHPRTWVLTVSWNSGEVMIQEEW